MVVSSYAREKIHDTIPEAPTSLNLGLGTGSRVLYPLSLLRSTAVGKLLRSLCLVLFVAGFLLLAGAAAALSTAREPQQRWFEC